MRLLVITAFYPPHHSGGYELRCEDVLTSLKSLGHQITVITNRCPEINCEQHPDEKNIYRVLHTKNRSSSFVSRVFCDLYDLVKIDAIFKSFKPDIVYFWHLGDLSNAIIPYFSNQNVPMVYDEGGAGLVRTIQILERGPYFYKNSKDTTMKKWLKKIITASIGPLSFNLIDISGAWPRNMRIFFNSQYSLEYAQRNGVPVENARVIHSGIKLQQFQFRSRNDLKTPIRILVPGRITPIKGTKDALLLIRELFDHGINTELEIIGKVVDYDYFDEMQQIIAKLEISHLVNYLPMICHNDLSKYYQEADFCFFPSRQRYGLSRVPLEAMSSGSLVISYGNEGSNEIIKNNETGIIVDEGDIKAAADCIIQLILNPGVYQFITENARREVVAYHSMEAYAAIIDSCLRSIKVARTW